MEATNLRNEATQGSKCPDCGGAGGSRWREADGSENGERCTACDGFGCLNTATQMVTDEVLDVAEEAWSGVYDGVSHNRRDAMRAALTAAIPLLHGEMQRPSAERYRRKIMEGDAVACEEGPPLTVIASGPEGLEFPELDWPANGRFTVKDEPGEHDPCWLILPGGEMLALNHHAINGVDQARAKFIADAGNAALARVQGGAL